MPNYNYGNYPYGMPYQPFMPQNNYSGNNNNNGNPNVYQQPQQPQAQMTQCFWVNGTEGAKAFQMQPNQTIMLMDSESPVVYMKQTNGMGQATLKYYKLTEVSEQDVRNQNTQPQTQNIKPNEEYVLKSDFEILSKRLDDLSKRFEKPYKNDKNIEKGGN